MCRIWSLYKASVDRQPYFVTGIVTDDVIVIIILAHETKTILS